MALKVEVYGLKPSKMALKVEVYEKEKVRPSLKVEVYEKEKVRPSSPTPQTLRYHKLSLLDVLSGPFYAPHVLFYPSGAGPRRHDYDELKESLSKTLSILYPLAGRLKDGSIIECNDEGADFVRANVTNYDLGEFLRHPKQEDLRQLLPLEPYPEAIDPAMPMLAVQVNRFRCGETAVGFCTWHGVTDGGGVAGFYNILAAINRGEGPTDSAGGLVVDVAAIFSPAIPNISQVMLTAYAGMKKELRKYTTKRFVFSKQDIEPIRNQYSQSEHHRRPSRVDARIHMGGSDKSNSSGQPNPQDPLALTYCELSKEVEPALTFKVPRQHPPRD
ncbi:stemmadenine O-acetyltransferase-like [Ipomoea triloba]|uniref:stemmadenine O-acetyltransferase-like n=1 Tax=Ipomoea triloba TaxID=35885 RepID=UPI00125E5EC5|nr:stemmadenine O-acetyltransferase-like [Ipomoea triloba]